MKSPAGARAMALSSSYVAAADNSEAIFWNPAGMARLEGSGQSDLSLSYNSLLETSYASTVGYALPLSGERGVIGLSMVYFSQSSIQGYSPLGDPGDSFQPYDLAFTGGYAKKIGKVRVGGSAKFIRSKLSDASGSAFALDFGLQGERVTDLGEGALDIGVSVRNLGPAIRLGAIADPLPFKLQMGALWHISPRLKGMLDGHMPVDEAPFASVGAEWNYPVAESTSFAFRAGYNVRNDRDIEGLTGFSGGFGLSLTQFRIDYAWVPLGDLGMTHRISLGFKF